MSNSRISILATAALLLLVPYFELLYATWTGSSKVAASSALAFAAGLAMAWRRRDVFRDEGHAGDAGVGIAVLLVAALAYAAAVLFDVRIVAGLGAVGIVAALILLYGGSSALRAMALPLALLLLATPPPGFLLGAMTQTLVAITVFVTPLVLGPFVGRIEIEGAVLHMTGGSVAVVDDCSGLGGVLLFVPLALVLVGLQDRVVAWKAALLPIVGIVLAFVGSLLRVWISAILVRFDLPLAESDVAHEVLGMVSLGSALVALFVGSQLCSEPVEPLVEEPA